MAHERVYKTDKKVNVLDSAVGLVLKSCSVPQSLGTDDNFGNKTVKAGTIFPANDGTAKGILFEGVDVTLGEHEASLIVEGRIIEERLPVAVETEAKTALEAVGIRFVTEEVVTRPVLDTVD